MSTVAAPAAPAPDSGQPGLSQGARILNTFFAPSKTFTDIKRSASWWAPFLLLAVFSYGFVFTVTKKVGWDQVMQNQIRMNPKQAAQLEQLPPDQRAPRLRVSILITEVIAYGAPVFRLIFFVILAAVLMATFNFGAGAEIPFSQSLAVVTYAGLPNIIKAALASVALLAGADPEGFILQNPAATNPAYFMEAAKSLTLYSLAASVDIITIWVLILTAIGFARVSKLKTSTTMGVVFGWYVVATLLSAGFAALTS